MSKKAAGKLSNPTHKVVGPDGTEYFLIRHTRNTLRIKVLYDAPNWVDVTPAGTVSVGWGPSAADAVMMGRWTSPLIYHFTAGALDLLPDGTRCVEVAPEPSDYDYRSDVIWSGWSEPGDVSMGLRRAGLTQTPLFRPQLDAARPIVEAHRQALIDGSCRADEIDDALRAEFLIDADRALAYLDFMDSVPELATRPRKAVAA